MVDTPKPRILAVDDSRVMRRAMTKVLGKYYDVVEAEHGEDAWTYLLDDSNFQIIFTDLSMPYLDGIGLLDRIRSSEDPHLQDIPVIIITGKDDDDETKQQVLDKGANDFITKPFDSVQLLARAKTHIRYEETSRKLNETSDRLEQQAAIDLITGLGGRRYFCKAAEEQLAYIQRHGEQLIVLRIDIDNFNQLFINLGKENSNTMLKSIGETFSKIVRKEDMAARIGVGKFAMLMRDTTMEDATASAKRIIKEIAELSIQANGTPIKVTASAGILEPQVDPDSSIEALITEAEIYLQKAMDAGGNQVAVKSLRKSPVEKEISVQTALRLLEFGHEENIQPHITSLVTQLLPLLEYLAKHLDGAAADSFSGITEKLKPK